MTHKFSIHILITSLFISISNVTSSQTAPEFLLNYTRQVLETLQPLSIKNNVESCGYIILRPNNIMDYKWSRGERHKCEYPTIFKPNEILFAFHTHGAHDPDFHSEVPSKGDFKVFDQHQKKFHQFIGTPNGSIWFMNYKTKMADLVICEGSHVCLTAQVGIPYKIMPTSITIDYIKSLLSR